VPGWVAQVHDERVQIVGQALGRVGEAALVEVVDERLEPVLGVAFVDRVIERLPVRVLDAFAFALGQLGGKGCARGARSSAGGQRRASTARSP
jgi:hypothetical protein